MTNRRSPDLHETGTSLTPRRAVLLTALMALGSVACSNAATGTRTPSQPPPEQSITRFDPSPRQINVSFYALNELARTSPTALRQAALKHLGDRDPRVHYAAVYALGLTATLDQGSPT